MLCQNHAVAYWHIPSSICASTHQINTAARSCRSPHRDVRDGLCNGRRKRRLEHLHGLPVFGRAPCLPQYCLCRLLPLVKAKKGFTLVLRVSMQQSQSARSSAQVPSSWLAAQTQNKSGSAASTSSLQTCSFSSMPVQQPTQQPFWAVLLRSSHLLGLLPATQRAAAGHNSRCVLPFASISSPGGLARPPARVQQPIKTGNSKHTDGAGGTGQEGSVMSHFGTEDESVTESDDSEMLMPSGSRLDKRNVRVFCSTCRHNTVFDDEEDLVECSCCHRVFHNTCYDRHVARTEGLSLPDPDDWDTGVPWFHSNACKKVYEGVHNLLSAGEQPIAAASHTSQQHKRGLWPATWFGSPSSNSQGSSTSSNSSTNAAGSTVSEAQPRYSWRLVPCATQGSSAAVRIGMSQVYSILCRDFKYTMGDYSTFDVAALLKRDGQPACAAVLDIYGADVAEIFVVATRRDLREQGHCRMLMQQLAQGLGAAGIKRMVVSIDDDDAQALDVWDKLGFTPLAETSMRQLAWSIPAFSSEATEGTLYLGQDLKATKKGLFA